MFAVHVKRAGNPPLQNDIHYIIAENGIFLRKQTGWADAIVPVASVSGLEKQEASIRILLPPMPARIVAEAAAFFRKVYKLHRSESAVLVHFGESGWKLTVPQQIVSYAHVRYEESAADRIPGMRCVGTMHSHCDFGAFHSGVDTKDEATMDGVHITIGRVHTLPLVEIDAEAVVNGTRFKLPAEFLCGVADAVEPVPGWKQKLGSVFGHTVRPKSRIDMTVLQGWSVPSEWIERINKQKPVEAPPTDAHEHRRSERDYPSDVFSPYRYPHEGRSY